jgi:hypothetical protein
MTTKQVTITARVIFHKLASVTIDVPSEITEDQIQNWLYENEGLYSDALEDAIEYLPSEHGFGLCEGMDEQDSEYEARFDLIEDNQITFGGHL